MPKKFNYFEASIRPFLRNTSRGGRLTCSSTTRTIRRATCALSITALAAEYMDYFNRMAEEFSIQNDVKVSTLAKFPEVFSMEQAPDDEEHLWGILSAALEDAAVRFVQSREVEGEHLKNDLLGKLDYMTGLVDYIEGRSPQILTEYRAKLEAKVQELLNGTAMDEGRIAAEVTIYADKHLRG